MKLDEQHHKSISKYNRIIGVIRVRYLHVAIL